MRKPTLSALGLSLLLAYGAPAHATTLHVGVCTTLAQSFADGNSSVNDDFFNPGSGAVTEPAYDVWLVSKMIVHGNTIVYRKLSTNSKQAHVYDSVVFTTDNAYATLAAPPASKWARTLEVLAFALSRKDAGMTGETIDVYGMDDDNTSPLPCGSTTSCNAGNDIYFEEDGSDDTIYKSVLAHEFGLQVLRRVAVYTVPSPAYGASGANACAGGAGHTLITVENHSAAVKEGFAKFYVDAVFNLTAGPDCGAYTHASTDFDLAGGASATQLYDCDDAPIAGAGLSAADWENDECTGTDSLFGLATTYDYERFFWDMAETENASVADLVDVISDANMSGPWNSASIASDPDNVDARLAGAAAMDGWNNYPDYVWATEAATNGVDR